MFIQNEEIPKVEILWGFLHFVAFSYRMVHRQKLRDAIHTTDVKHWGLLAFASIVNASLMMCAYLRNSKGLSCGLQRCPDFKKLPLKTKIRISPRVCR